MHSPITEEGQPPIEILSKQVESEAAASDADTSQVSVSSLPEDEGTVSMGLQHQQGEYGRLDRSQLVECLHYVPLT